MMNRIPNRKSLVLAAGRGTRLKPITDQIPKCLVEIDARPLLDYWFDRLEACNVSEALVNTHHLPEQVREFLEHARETRPFELHESYEPELLGSAGTITNNVTFVKTNEICVIIYADNLSTVDLEVLIEFHLGHEDPFTMLLFHTTRPRECGIAELDDSGRIIDFSEKPESPKSTLANAGVYVVDGDLYAEIAAMDAFDIGFDVLPRLLGRMRGFPFEGFHLDIGNFEALEYARRESASIFGGRK